MQKRKRRLSHLITNQPKPPRTSVFPPATRRGRDLCRVKPPSRVISSAQDRQGKLPAS